MYLFKKPSNNRINELIESQSHLEWLEDDSVWYDIFAFSRPNQLLARLAYPYVRLKRKQFGSESKQTLKVAVTSRWQGS